MCRLLLVKEKNSFNPQKYLESFSIMCKNSKEYQGHGWGLAMLVNGEWKIYKNIKPVWEDNLDQFEETNLLLVHARSAFEDKDIFVENNMPFIKDDMVFIFNGELRGVKLKMHGRIGAEKIFNFILKFYDSSLLDAVKKASNIIIKRTAKIRAMNFLVVNKYGAILHSYFTEDEEYFTLRKYSDDNKTIICSEEINIGINWEKVNNNIIEEIKW